MTAEEYLSRIRENPKKIKSKQEEYEYWMELAKATTSQIGERVQSSASGNGKTDKIDEAVLIAEEIERLRQEIAEVMLTIKELPTKYHIFLHKVYVKGEKLKDIAAEEQQSYSWATTTHRVAKGMIQKILDERELIIVKT